MGHELEWWYQGDEGGVDGALSHWRELGRRRAAGDGDEGDSAVDWREMKNLAEPSGKGISGKELADEEKVSRKLSTVTWKVPFSDLPPEVKDAFQKELAGPGGGMKGEERVRHDGGNLGRAIHQQLGTKAQWTIPTVRMDITGYNLSRLSNAGNPEKWAKNPPQIHTIKLYAQREVKNGKEYGQDLILDPEHPKDFENASLAMEVIYAISEGTLGHAKGVAPNHTGAQEDAWNPYSMANVHFVNGKARGALSPIGLDPDSPGHVLGADRHGNPKSVPANTLFRRTFKYEPETGPDGQPIPRGDSLEELYPGNKGPHTVPDLAHTLYRHPHETTEQLFSRAHPGVDPRKIDPMAHERVGESKDYADVYKVESNQEDPENLTPEQKLKEKFKYTDGAREKRNEDAQALAGTPEAQERLTKGERSYTDSRGREHATPFVHPNVRPKSPESPLSPQEAVDAMKPGVGPRQQYKKTEAEVQGEVDPSEVQHKGKPIYVKDGGPLKDHGLPFGHGVNQFALLDGHTPVQIIRDGGHGAMKGEFKVRKPDGSEVSEWVPRKRLHIPGQGGPTASLASVWARWGRYAGSEPVLLIEHGGRYSRVLKRGGSVARVATSLLRGASGF